MLSRAIAVSALLTAMVTAAQAAPTNLYFSDGFAGKKSFFEGSLDQREFRYADGKYEIDTTAGTTYGQSVLLGDLTEYRVQATGQMTSAGDRNSGFGLTVNYRAVEGGSPEFLLFLVYDQGYYTLLRFSSGKTETLIPPSATKLFKPGEAVDLKVDNDNGQLTFYIEGVESAVWTERHLTSGGFGMFTSAGSVARFDDFQVFAEASGGFTDAFEGQKVLFSGSWGEVGYRYEGGKYIVDTSSTGFNGLSPYPQPALNLEFSADVERTGGRESGSVGIYVRDHAGPDGSFNQYRFLVSGGWYAVERSVGDRPMALAQWTESSAVNKRGVNRLKVRAQSGELLFFVNEQEVYRAKDDAPSSGAFGFFASSGVQATFDNARFTPLQ
ncbi:MAG: hypothetical protein M3R04_02245 [bacterium]|nr:hypothetical protein [bacterium]